MEFGLHRFHGGKWIACLVFTSHSATEPRDLRKRKNDKVSRVGYIRILVEGKGADRAGGHRHITRHVAELAPPRCCLVHPLAIKFGRAASLQYEFGRNPTPDLVTSHELRW